MALHKLLADVCSVQKLYRSEHERDVMNAGFAAAVRTLQGRRWGLQVHLEQPNTLTLA